MSATPTGDPRILTIREAKTYRVVFVLKDALGHPVSLAGYGARFQVLAKPDGQVIVAVDDTTPDPGNPADADIQIEPGTTPATGEIHIRLGADQTSLITKSGVYDCSIYSKTDATEVQPVCAGPIVLLRVGDE